MRWIVEGHSPPHQPLSAATSGWRRAASPPASDGWSRQSPHCQSCAAHPAGARPEARRDGVRQSAAANSRPCWHPRRLRRRSPCSQAPRQPRARSAPAVPRPVRSSAPAPALPVRAARALSGRCQRQPCPSRRPSDRLHNRRNFAIRTLGFRPVQPVLNVDKLDLCPERPICPVGAT